jgi:CheY-like chemotaxis protein
MTDTRVLLVDDEPLNLEILVDYFEGEAPFSVETADSGEAAWKLLKEPGADFKLILLDRMMPGLDGIGLLKRIKTDPALAVIPSSCRPPQIHRNRSAKAWRRAPITT